MLKQFENWLIEHHYSPNTAFDYQGRIERLCRSEDMTIDHLIQNISFIIPQYEDNGEKYNIGRKSHTSVKQALRRFYAFLSSLEYQKGEN